MSAELVYAVDLDDTLVYSAGLNNDAYNYALEKYGYPKLDKIQRITRNNITRLYPSKAKIIIREKQRYFTEAWTPCRLKLNKELLKFLAARGRENCILWTAAERKRAIKIISQYGLDKYFFKTVFDGKTNIIKSIEKIFKHTKAKYVVGIDDNKEYIPSNPKHIVSDMGRIVNGKFDVGVWLLRL